MKTLLVVDIDNTVAENAQREHLLPDWTAFFRACDTDTPISLIIDALRPAFEREDVDIIFVTGRNADDEVVRKTQIWLDGHLPTRPVFYRPIGNYSKAAIYKTGVVDKYKTDEHTKIVIVDDDENICQHFQNAGHVAIQIHKDRYEDNARNIGTVLGLVNPYQQLMDNLDAQADRIRAHLTSSSFHEEQFALFCFVDQLNGVDGTTAQQLLDDNPIFDRSKLLSRAARKAAGTAIEHLMAGGVPEKWVQDAILEATAGDAPERTIRQLLSAQPMSDEGLGKTLSMLLKTSAIEPKVLAMVDLVSEYCSSQVMANVLEEEKQFSHMPPMARLRELKQAREDKDVIGKAVGNAGIEGEQKFKL